jgi:hypothetical protein
MHDTISKHPNGRKLSKGMNSEPDQKTGTEAAPEPTVSPHLETIDEYFERLKKEQP